MADGREGGFVVLARRVRSSALYQSLTAEQRSVFNEVLLACNWKPTRMLYAGKWVEIDRGEYADTLETIAGRARVSVKVVRTTYAKLMLGTDSGTDSAEEPFASVRWTGGKPGTGLRIVRVLKYDQYQSIALPVGSQEGTDSGREKAGQGQRKGSAGAPSEPVEPLEPVEASPAEAPVGAPLVLSPPVADQPKKTSTDPRFAPLKAAWFEEYAAVHGTEYHWSPADSVGIHRVIAVSVDEFRERARRGLNATGYLRCGSAAKLTSNDVWNQLAGVGPPGPRLVTAAASDHSKFQGGKRDVRQ